MYYCAYLNLANAFRNAFPFRAAERHATPMMAGDDHVPKATDNNVAVASEPSVPKHIVRLQQSAYMAIRS